MTIVARVPSPILAPFVSWLGYYETLFPAVREVLMPRGAMALVVNLAGDDARWYDGDGFATRTSRRARWWAPVPAGSGSTSPSWARSWGCCSGRAASTERRLVAVRAG
jgi:hypothetical protein